MLNEALAGGVNAGPGVTWLKVGRKAGRSFCCGEGSGWKLADRHKSGARGTLD